MGAIRISIFLSAFVYLPNIGHAEICQKLADTQIWDQGSGLCTGTDVVVIPLPTVGASLIRRTAGYNTNVGIGNGWSFHFDMRYNSATQKIYLPDQSAMKFVQVSSTVEVEDHRWGQFQLSNTMSTSSDPNKMTNANLMIASTASGESYVFQKLSSVGVFHLNQITLPGNHTALAVERDSSARVKSFAYPMVTANTKATVSYAGSLVTITDPLGAAYKLQLSGQGELLKVVFPDLSSYEMKYGSLGELTHFKDNYGGKMRLAYDQTQRLVHVVHKNGVESRIIYDDENGVVTLKDPGLTLTEKFDKSDPARPLLKELILSGEDGSAGMAWSFDRDNSPLRRITKMQPPMGSFLSFSYLDNRYVLSSVNESTYASYQYKYSEADGFLRLQSVTANKNGSITSSHFSWTNGFLTSFSSNSKTWTITRDSSGNPLSLTDPSGLKRFQATFSGDKITSLIDPFGFMHQINYDDRRIDYRDPSGLSTSVYLNNLGLPFRVTSPNGIADLEYDSVGERIGSVFKENNGHVYTHTQEANRRTEGSLSSITETKSVNGNVVSSETTEFDERNELRKVTTTDSRGSTVDYDASLSKKPRAVPEPYHPQVQDR